MKVQDRCLQLGDIPITFFPFQSSSERERAIAQSISSLSRSVNSSCIQFLNYLNMMRSFKEKIEDTICWLLLRVHSISSLWKIASSIKYFIGPPLLLYRMETCRSKNTTNGQKLVIPRKHAGGSSIYHPHYIHDIVLRG